jgi:hypothetical protein
MVDRCVRPGRLHLLTVLMQGVAESSDPGREKRSQT